MGELLPEDLLPQLMEQFRDQMSNLTAAIQLITPVVRERGERRYDQYLAVMNQSLYRMLRTLRSVEFIQLPEGEESLREAGLNLTDLCREVADQAASLARHAQVQFAYEEETALLLTTGDAGLLRRMLYHLISNALRAAGSGGQAGLRLSQNRDRAVLTVWDSGPGLDAGGSGEGARLLKRPEGLGLGLLVARRIAALHGGALVLEQREARGVRAVASLPIRPPKSNGMLCTPVMGYDGGGGFSTALVELSSVLPYQAFLPEDLE